MKGYEIYDSGKSMKNLESPFSISYVKCSFISFLQNLVVPKSICTLI